MRLRPGENQESNPYVRAFFRLRALRDILSLYRHPPKNFYKEVTEAMATHNLLKRKVKFSQWKDPAVVEFAAGNCLFSLLNAFILRPITVYALDRNPCPIEASRVNRFEYHQTNIFSPETRSFLSKIRKRHDLLVLVGIHACKEASRQIVRFYELFGDYIILMPCCVGNRRLSMPLLFQQTFSEHDLWAIELWLEVKAASKQSNILRDEKVLSPRNILVWGTKL